MTSTPVRIAVVLAAALAACAGSRTEQRPAPASSEVARPAPARGSAMAGGMACPMDVPGAKVEAQDTAQGEALTFTTSDPGQVTALRERVRALAEMHNRHMAGEAAGTGTGAGDAQHEAGHHHGMMPASRATPQDVDGGVRIDIVPEDPAQADQLRSMARTQAQRMQTQGCGMMHRE